MGGLIGFVVGFVVGAVSPLVVVAALMELHRRGKGRSS
jgi:hypothetical protein